MYTGGLAEQTKREHQSNRVDFSSSCHPLDWGNKQQVWSYQNLGTWWKDAEILGTQDPKRGLCLVAATSGAQRRVCIKLGCGKETAGGSPLNDIIRWVLGVWGKTDQSLLLEWRAIARVSKHIEMSRFLPAFLLLRSPLSTSYWENLTRGWGWGMGI